MSVNFFIQEKILKSWLSTNRFIVAHGGRGSSKSMSAAGLCVIHASKTPNQRILCVRGTQNKISESSLQTLKDVISMMKLDDYFIMTENTLKCKNGSEFLFYGAKNYQSFKSLQGVNLVWIDEATELSKSAWEVLIPTIREEGSRFIITFNPDKEEDWVYKSFITNKYPNSIVNEINYYDNPYFPDELRQIMEWDKENDLLKYEHIWEGKLNKKPEGSLFKSEWIEVEDIDFNECNSIVVAIDPSGSSKITSDACGIVVTGKKGNKYYVLDDLTKISTPLEWANTAISAYRKWNADYIVYESNFGGDIVKTVISQIDRSILVKEVRASRGKLIRAEPVASLYQQGLVNHIKRFKDLEYEMITYVGDSSQRSPNRLDALVYSIMSQEVKTVKVATGMNFRI